MILKPGKDPKSPENYRPISLLSISSKIFQRLILNTLNERFPEEIFVFSTGILILQQYLQLSTIKDTIATKDITTAALLGRIRSLW